DGLTKPSTQAVIQQPADGGRYEQYRRIDRAQGARRVARGTLGAGKRKPHAQWAGHGFAFPHGGGVRGVRRPAAGAASPAHLCPGGRRTGRAGARAGAAHLYAGGVGRAGRAGRRLAELPWRQPVIELSREACTMNPIVVAALYKFVRLENAESLQAPLLETMQRLHVRGTLLL